ncbi:MAG: rRNA maturation RNase YbeY [Prevotellaceae bacterium]|jgi:rRNA maturation RNase YbeY|nr:rRNA maturation RNase YbeY [Prevotellaceae bacterium]
MEINFFSEDIRYTLRHKKKLRGWIIAIVKNEEMSLNCLNFIFCSDPYLLSINQQYLHHNYFTDVITFDYSEGSVISGDIFISIDTVKSNAVEYEVPFTNELHRVMVHGVLHLCGYKDNTDIGRIEMKGREDFYLHRNEI